MADDLKQFLSKKLPSVEGLHAVVVSDRVPVIKVANDNAPEHALRPGYLLLPLQHTMGANSDFQKINYHLSNANVGLIVSLEKELAPLFEELRQVVEVS
ncbi:hypothetical protein E2I00_008521 [Balaenoptera physalus]|uniref:Ragulator complex protein LAMTOR3 n=1 Tax=Balaenoptera physalus TaxID=9770 RepID=A0A643BQ55_BALPH|nr:hypothetical protein E2I00_008521 [Balaenoptera physalus]